jgi:hypothetical protein
MYDAYCRCLLFIAAHEAFIACSIAGLNRLNVQVKQGTLRGTGAEIRVFKANPMPGKKVEAALSAKQPRPPRENRHSYSAYRDSGGNRHESHACGAH